MSDHDGHIELERRVDSIVVGTRHRKHPEDGIEPLIMSIRKLGLLQPVTITPDGVLVCGARRLEAVKRLGWRTLKVWVRSGISDDLNRLLAQQDENAERIPLNQREQAALFEELCRLIREDSAHRQAASQFGEGGKPKEGSGPGSGPGPLPGHGDTRHQAAVAVTGKASYHHLERISTIERVAANRALPEVLRKIAEVELAGIADGGDVRPAFDRVMRARELIAVNDSPQPTGPVTDEELETLANEAIELVKQQRNRRGTGAKTDSGTPKPRPSYRSLRAFVLTWGDLDGWSRFYNPTEIASQIKATDWEMFERVLAETVAFADEVRALRSASISA